MIKYLLFYLFLKIFSYFKILINFNKNYNKNINENISVCFTTIPSRLNNIYYTLNSIFLQNMIPNKIIIGIPKKSMRENIKYVVPNNIKNDERIEIYIIEKDYGPICKLITGLRQQNDIFITIDDDTIYSYDLIEKLYENYKKYNCIIGTIGRNKNKIKKFGKTNEKIYAIEGYGGVLYNKKYFNEEKILNFILKNEIQYLRLNDDLIISYFIKENNIKIKLINLMIKKPFASSLITTKTNPLWKINESLNNYKNISNSLKIFY